MFIKHGEAEVEIDKKVSDVFNFISGLSKYPKWHPEYTKKSKVRHIKGYFKDIKAKGVGSKFVVVEDINGKILSHHGIITEFVRNKKLKWIAKFADARFGWIGIYIGTCFTLKPTKSGKGTVLHEYFYFKIPWYIYPFVILITLIPGNGKVDVSNHQLGELSGIKEILEKGNYDKNDLDYIYSKV